MVGSCDLGAGGWVGVVVDFGLDFHDMGAWRGALRSGERWENVGSTGAALQCCSFGAILMKVEGQNEVID